MSDVVEMDRLYLVDVDRTLFRSGEFMLALHDALLESHGHRGRLPSREKVARDMAAESLPFASYYRQFGISSDALYAAAATLDDSYVYDDAEILHDLPGRVILYTKGERTTQEIKLHHGKLSKNPGGVWIVETNKGMLLKGAIDECASSTEIVVLRWNGTEYRTRELVFVDDKYDEIRPLVGLALSGLPLSLAHIVRKDGKYGAADDRDGRAVVQIETLRDLERKLRVLRNGRNSR